MNNDEQKEILNKEFIHNYTIYVRYDNANSSAIIKFRSIVDFDIVDNKAHSYSLVGVSVATVGVSEINCRYSLLF